MRCVRVAGSPPKRSSMAGLNTCTARRAMVARFTRRISSSLFPLNMEPTMTSSPPWAEVPIGASYRLGAASAGAAGCSAFFVPKRLLKRSTRPWMSRMCCLPVKNGWHFAHTSTCRSGLVDPVTKVLPQAQVTFACAYLGWIFSFMGSFSLYGRDHVDPAAVVTCWGIAHFARDEREERVVLADTDVLARQHLGAALANEDRTGLDLRPGVFLHAETLARRIAAVAGGTCAFFVCHLLCLDLRDPDRRLALPMSARLALARLVLVTEDVDLRALAVGDDLRRDLRA